MSKGVTKKKAGGAKESYASWAHPGDIQCENTDTGVLLTIRQPKKAAIAIRNEKGLVLQLFIDPRDMQVTVVRGEDIFIKDALLAKSDKFLGWNDGDRAMLISIEEKCRTWGESVGLQGRTLDTFVETKMNIVIKEIFSN